MKMLPPSKSLILRSINFFNDGLNNSNFVNFFFNNCLKNKCSTFYRNLLFWSISLNRGIDELLQMSKGELSSLIGYDDDWKVDIIRELLQCLEGSMSSNLDTVQLLMILYDLCVN